MAAKYVGAHMPTGKGLAAAMIEARTMGCTAVQVFTSSPRQWKSSPPTEEKIVAFKNAVAETQIDHLISHDSYLVNLCPLDDAVAAKSMEALRDEILRCASYGIPLAVSHLGALLGQPAETGYAKIAAGVLQIFEDTPDTVTLLAETTAGQGSAVNSKFEELALLLELVKGHPRLGVCVDTCHIFAAGYDIRTAETYNATIEAFDKTIGLDRLKAFHLNDSKKGLGSRVDRHTHIGDGELGIEPFRLVMNDPRLADIPMVLETPVENEGHERDLKTLLGLRA